MHSNYSSQFSIVRFSLKLEYKPNRVEVKLRRLPGKSNAGIILFEESVIGNKRRTTAQRAGRILP